MLNAAVCEFVIIRFAVACVSSKAVQKGKPVALGTTAAGSITACWP